jgi:hypothetical protein
MPQKKYSRLGLDVIQNVQVVEIAFTVTVHDTTDSEFSFLQKKGYNRLPQKGRYVSEKKSTSRNSFFWLSDSDREANKRRKHHVFCTLS